jgi:hypothetical protein
MYQSAPSKTPTITLRHADGRCNPQRQWVRRRTKHRRSMQTIGARTLTFGDGVTPVAGYRVVCAAQTTVAQDGVYIAAAGSWTRAPDAPTGANLTGRVYYVQRGTAGGGKLIKCINAPTADVVGTSDLVFADAAGAGGSGSPGGATPQIQYNNAGAFAGAAKLSIGSLGNLEFDDNVAASLPTSPAEAGGVLLYNRVTRHHRELVAAQAEHRTFMLQGSLSDKAIEIIRPNPGAATLVAVGCVPVNTGTLTARAIATTNLATRLRRLGFVSAATAGASAGTRGGVLAYTIGGTGQFGGFYWKVRFSISQVQAQGRWFVGMNSSAAVIGNVNPSTLTNMIAFGCDSAQTTVRLLQCGAANPANFTATDLGANFPAATAGTVYEATFIATPITGRISVALLNLGSGAYFEDQLSINFPALTQLLAWQIWANNGTTAAAVDIDLINHYLECDA